MKKFQLLFCAIALAITSCTPSNEEKAALLVENTIKSSLDYPDSYEAISMRVDSMFIDAAAIKPIMEISEEIKHLISCVNRTEQKIKSTELSMDFYAPYDYSPQYVLDEYVSAEKEKEEAESNLEKYNVELSRALASLKANIDKYYTDTFTGWIVMHRYNALNEYGLTPIIPNEDIFFCDEEFSSCRIMSGREYVDFQNILGIVEKSESERDLIENFRDEFFVSPYQVY